MRGECIDLNAMKLSILFLLTSLLVGVSSPLLARDDVHVKGYYRKDGTYVRPHIRSSPGGIRSNNYGPSRSDHELMNPRSRDYDRDGGSELPGF